MLDCDGVWAEAEQDCYVFEHIQGDASLTGVVPFLVILYDCGTGFVHG